jgi:hypothetical protein
LRIDLRALVAASLLALPLGAAAQNAAMQVPMLDPWVPPEVRAKAALESAPQTSGAELKAQVQKKLRSRFDVVAGPGGSVTRAQAQAGGLGAVARDFEAIDVNRRGQVSFDEYWRFLEAK